MRVGFFGHGTWPYAWVTLQQTWAVCWNAAYFNACGVIQVFSYVNFTCNFKTFFVEYVQVITNGALAYQQETNAAFIAMMATPLTRTHYLPFKQRMCPVNTGHISVGWGKCLREGSPEAVRPQFFVMSGTFNQRLQPLCTVSITNGSSVDANEQARFNQWLAGVIDKG